jgi:hypothetical protein
MLTSSAFASALLPCLPASLPLLLLPVTCSLLQGSDHFNIAMMKMRTGLLLLAGVVVLACVMSSVNARVMDGAAVSADGVATATPMKPISTVISWKTGGKKDKYGDKYAHKHGESGVKSGTTSLECCWVARRWPHTTQDVQGLCF